MAYSSFEYLFLLALLCFLGAVTSQPRFVDQDCFNRCMNDQAEEPCLISIFRQDAFADLQGFAQEMSPNPSLTTVGVPANNQGFRNVNITNPLNTGLDGVFDGNAFSSAEFFDEEIVLAITGTTLIVFNISAGVESGLPTGLNYTSTLLGSLSITSVARSIGATTQNPPRAYISTTEGGVGIVQVNLDNFTNPHIESTLNTDLPGGDLALSPDQSWLIFVSGGTAGQGQASLVRIPALQGMEDGVQLGGPSTDVEINREGNFAVVAGNVGLDLIDTSNAPETISLIDSERGLSVVEIDFATSTPGIPNAPQDRVILIANDDLVVYDIAQSSFRFVGRFSPSASFSEEAQNEIVGQFVPLQLVLSPDQRVVWVSAGLDGISSFCTGTLLTRAAQNPSEDLGAGAIAGVVIGGLVACVLCVGCVAAVLLFPAFVRRKRNEVFDKNSHELKISKEKNYLTDVTLGAVLGRGQFSLVYHGKWRSTPVALKTIESIDDFGIEYSLLTSLSHPHIIPCFGVTSLDAEVENQVFLVLELMQGDMLSLLRQEIGITEKELCSMTHQTALGMEFLHSKDILHRDLACRNLLITKAQSGYLVKVSDFGLSRQTENYYQSKSRTIAIKWSAPEAINFQKFSKASDIWSYGVVIWEIFSRGAVPYAASSNEEVLKKVEEGYRMEFVQNTPEHWVKIGTSCWLPDPKDRPTFSQIISSVPEEIKETEKDLGTVGETVSLQSETFTTSFYA